MQGKTTVEIFGQTRKNYSTLVSQHFFSSDFLFIIKEYMNKMRENNQEIADSLKIKRGDFFFYYIH